jgi:hypothetical protein
MEDELVQAQAAATDGLVEEMSEDDVVAEKKQSGDGDGIIAILIG